MNNAHRRCINNGCQRIQKCDGPHDCELNAEISAPFDLARAQSPAEAHGSERDAQEQPFEDWWEREGQFGRAGGGQYEKTFAWNAWCAASKAQPKGMPVAWRPEVVAFADAMERKLRANDWKGTWKHDAPGALMDRVHEELTEFRDELFTRGPRDTDAHKAALLNEAADVANMLMMVVDTSGALPVPSPAPVAGGYKQAPGSKNCMQSAVAYMLGLPIEAVPDFEKAGPHAWDLFEQFFDERGFSAEMFPPTVEIAGDYLASGSTGRGTSHMVVMRGGKLLHDPHPSNAGLTSLQVVWVIARKAGPCAAVAHQPLTDEQVAAAFSADEAADCIHNFTRGVMAAESAHGIGCDVPVQGNGS